MEPQNQTRLLRFNLIKMLHYSSGFPYTSFRIPVPLSVSVSLFFFRTKFLLTNVTTPTRRILSSHSPPETLEIGCSCSSTSAIRNCKGRFERFPEFELKMQRPWGTHHWSACGRNNSTSTWRKIILKAKGYLFLNIC